MPDTTERLRGLIDAGIALSSELSLDDLLQKLVETAVSLTGARYAALGVIDASGSELERFITTGIPPEQHATIGELPRGRGLLGVLIEHAEPLRLEAIEDDPRSVGFPPNHPEMRGFLGVPILLRGQAYGNLYLTEKAGGPFTAGDQELIETLASQAAVAIENARLLEAATSRAAQLEALNDVGVALAGEVDLPRLLHLICRRLRALIGARVVTIALLAPDGELRIDAADGASTDGALGLRLEGAGSKSGRVLERRRAERVDSLADDPEVDREAIRRFEARSGLYVPLIAGTRSIGVVIAHDKLGSEDVRFDDEDLRLAETFATRAAIAVDLSARVARDALRRIVEAQELERRRLARELHDQTGQELTSVLLGLKSVEEAKTDAERAEALAGVREQVVETLRDVRRLAVELRPKALDDFGLTTALERLRDTFSEHTGMRVELEARIGERLPAEVETALYRIVQEALTNIVKHAQAGSISIVLGLKSGAATVVIEDDGRGFDREDATEGLGLLGMRERLALLGGKLQIESSPGSGTTIVAEVPLR